MTELFSNISIFSIDEADHAGIFTRSEYPLQFTRPPCGFQFLNRRVPMTLRPCGPAAVLVRLIVYDRPDAINIPQVNDGSLKVGAVARFFSNTLKVMPMN